MNATTLTQTLNTLIAANEKLPAFIWGAPGIGKSAVVKSVANSNNLDMIDLRLGQIPPSDLRGLPYIKDSVAHYARPEWLRPDGAGILFLDELSNAVPSVQGLSQQLLLDRRVGEHKLGDGWFVIGAGNNREHGAAVHGMPTPVANRMIHLEMEAEIDSWKAYAIGANMNADIIAFLSFRPEFLFKLHRKQRAFPSPRSWEAASILHSLG